jgi:hypothetical protein
MKFSKFIQDIKKRLFGSDLPSSHKATKVAVTEGQPPDKPQISVHEPFQKSDSLMLYKSDLISGLPIPNVSVVIW